MHGTWQKLLRSMSWLSEVGNGNTRLWQVGCKGEGLSAHGKDIALMAGQPRSCSWVGHGAECTWHPPRQLWLRADSRTRAQVCLNTPMHGWHDCVSAFPSGKGRQEFFPAPLRRLGGSSHSGLRRDHKSEALLCRGVYQKRPAINVPLSLPLAVTLWT